MRIRSLSNIILGTLFLAGITIGYMLWEMQLRDFSVYLIPIGIILAIILVFKPQIDYWWHKKHPLPLDKEVLFWLQNHFLHYNDLNEDDQARFRERLSLYLEGREFKIMRKEPDDLPHDFRVMISSHAILLSLYLDDFLIGDFDRIMCYKHAFPTPQFKFLHAVETHAEDGMIILSTEHLVLGVKKPELFLNIIIYAYAQALVFLNPSHGFPEFQESIWEDIEKISSFTKGKLSSLLGFEEPDPLFVCSSLYFTHADKFELVLPELKASFDIFFNRPA